MSHTPHDDMSEAKQDFAEELAAWIGPVLVDVGLVKASDDERVQEMAGLLATECTMRPYRGLTVARLAALLRDALQESAWEVGVENADRAARVQWMANWLLPRLSQPRE